MTPESKALEAIRAAAQEANPRLSLGDLGLTTIPEEIGELTHLEVLGLDNNLLTEVSPAVARLTRLQALSLSENRLGRLAPEIGNLVHLEELDLSGNMLTELPPEVVQLTSLRSLRIVENQLEALPAWIGQAQHLRNLHLAKNRITRIPPEIGRLSSLTRLDLRFNLLASVPPEIGDMKGLGVLNLANNRLTHLPAELGRLKRLHVAGRLRIGDVDGLHVYENPLVDPPESVRRRGMQAMLEYLRLRDGPDERRLILRSFDRHGDFLEYGVDSGRYRLLPREEVEERGLTNSFGVFTREGNSVFGVFATPTGPIVFHDALRIAAPYGMLRAAVQLDVQPSRNRFQLFRGTDRLVDLVYEQRLGIGVNSYDTTLQDVDLFANTAAALDREAFFTAHTREWDAR